MRSRTRNVLTVLGVLFATGCASEAAREENLTHLETSTSSTQGKKPICTVWSDPDTCSGSGSSGGTGGPGNPVEYDTVTIVSDTSVTFSFSTNLGPADVMIVWGPGTADAPATLASAEAAPFAAWSDVNEPSLYDHSRLVTGLTPCAQQWYGMYVGGALMRSGSFITNPPGGMHLSVVATPQAKTADVLLQVDPGARSGYLKIEAESADHTQLLEYGDDRATVGTATRTIRNLRPSTSYTVRVFGCGESKSVAMTTNPLGMRWARWSTGEMSTGHMTASASLEINDAGYWHYTGAADEGGLLGDDYAATTFLTVPDPASGAIFAFQHGGSVAGKAEFGSSHEDWGFDGVSPTLANAFDDVAVGSVAWQFTAQTDLLRLGLDLLFEAPIVAGAGAALVFGAAQCADNPHCYVPAEGGCRCDY